MLIMESRTFNNMTSKAHSIKKQKSPSIDYNSTSNNFSLNFSSKKSRTQNHNKPDYLDRLRPMESIKAVTEHKIKLSKLYKSRLLPSQFLSTPVNVLERLTENLYTQSKKLEKMTETSREHEVFFTPMLKIEPKSTLSLKEKKSLDSHSYLNYSCKQILKDNKKSRKTLKMASMFLEKRAVLNNILTKNLDKLVKSESLNDFGERLKEAHDFLVKKERIQVKKRDSSQNLIYKTVRFS